MEAKETVPASRFSRLTVWLFTHELMRLCIQTNLEIVLSEYPGE